MTWRGSHYLVEFIGDWIETPGENRHSLFSGLQRDLIFRLLCFWLFIVKTVETLFYNVSFITFVSRSSIQMDRKFRPRIKSRRCWVCVRRNLLAHRKRRLSVDSQADWSLEEAQEISIPYDSTVSKETEKFVWRISPRKRNPEISTPLSTSSPHTNKRMWLFKVASREVWH